MNFNFILFFVGFVISLSNVCSSKSLKKPAKQHNPIKPIRPIDSVRFSRSETSKLSSTDIRNLHHAFTLQNMTWRDGRVIYEIDKAFNGFERVAMFRAMDEIERSSCINFVKYDNNDNHQHFVKIHKDLDNECRTESDVGCQYKGQQDVWFGVGRFYVTDFHRVILHEFLHTLGFFDHLVRSDRDKYIEFHMENTKLNDSVIESDFVKLVDPDPKVHLLTSFDFDSVMMYDEYSHNGKELITSKIEGIKIPSGYDERSLSKYDKILLNKFYNCPDATVYWKTVVKP